MSSSQILQRSIVREKLKARQPDIYIDVEVDEFYVLDFHRFKQVLAAAAPAKEQLQAPARPRPRQPDGGDAAGRCVHRAGATEPAAAQAAAARPQAAAAGAQA